MCRVATGDLDTKTTWAITNVGSRVARGLAGLLGEPTGQKAGSVDTTASCTGHKDVSTKRGTSVALKAHVVAVTPPSSGRFRNMGVCGRRNRAHHKKGMS